MAMSHRFGRSEAHSAQEGMRRSIGELVALQAVGWPCATLVLSTVLFFAGISIGPAHLWIALLLLVSCGGWLAKDWKRWLLATAVLSLCSAVGGVALDWLYDFSGDGQWYHLPAIVALAQGWNPVLSPQLGDWNPALQRLLSSSDINYPSYIYIQHYAKAAWLIAAAAYRATAMLEATKVFNLLYIIAVYLFAVPLARRFGLGPRWSHLVAVAAAVNPVSLYQLGSFFVDGQLASLSTLVLLASLDYFRYRRADALFLLVASVVLLANVKFTGVVFSVALIIGLGVFAWFVGKRAVVGRYWSVGSASVLLAVVVVGYQPYITNLLGYGNPFYPALGREDSRNVQWHSAPQRFMSMSPPEKLVRSLFARSAGAEEMPEWKIPFAVSKQELYIFFNEEPRYAGFGPLFGGVLVCAVLVFALGRSRTERRVWGAGAVVAAVIAASSLVNPEAWWARLSPQLWLVPLALMVSILRGGKAWPRFSAGAVTVMLIADALLVGALNLGRATEKNLLFRTQLANLQAMSTAGPLQVSTHPSFRMATELRLRAHSLPYELVAKTSCADPYPFSYPASAQAAACPSRADFPK